MPIDPNIALSVKPAQFEDPINMMGRYAQLQQAQSANQLNALKMDEYQRSIQQQNALRSALTGVNINTPEGQLARDQAYVNQGMLDKLQEIKKSEAEVENLLSKSAEAKTDNITKRMALSKIRLEGVKTLPDYIAWHEENHTDPVLNDYYKSLGVKKDDALAKIQAVSQDPTAFQQMLLDSKVGVTNALKNHILSQDTGATTRLLSTPEYGPGAATVVPNSTVTKTLSPEAAAANARAKAAQDLLERKFAYEKANPGYTVQEAGDGSLIAINKNNPRDVQPVSMGGVPVKAKVSQSPESFVKADIQLANLSDSLKAFKDEVRKNKTTTGAWAPKGEDTASLTAKYQALLMRVKDLYQLGALTGPDMSIIEAQISNPASWSGMFVSGKGVDAQINTLERMITDGSKTLEDAYGRKPNATTKALSRAGTQDSEWSVVK